MAEAKGYRMIEAFTLVASVFAAASTVMFVSNMVLFRRADNASSGGPMPSVSVLIPARNEAVGIRRTLEAILANVGVRIEVLVLDDHSDDGTGQLVAQIATRDERVRLVQGQPLPSGWCGKQFACQQLADLASHDQLLFLDADVHLSADAIRRAVVERQRAGVALLSGFPRQLVGTLGESLLIPLMHIVLLTYLPFILMRRSTMPGASAGCGQFFLTSRAAYDQVGGHATVKASLHDGVQLPRRYRQSNLKTDVFDASDIATCRMYRGLRQTWHGLAKNAYEGIANERLIVPFSVLLLMGYVAPTILAAGWLLGTSTVPPIAIAGLVFSYIPRFLSAYRFDRDWLTAWLFPVSILLFLALQWSALLNHHRGTKSTWRGRAYPAISA
jgi:glycosyltransferase involved in cell wall biosynthesis